LPVGRGTRLVPGQGNALQCFGLSREPEGLAGFRRPDLRQEGVSEAGLRLKSLYLLTLA